MIYAVCALALLGCQAPQTAADTVLATYKLADREVAAKIPATKLALPACKSYKDGDWTYLFDGQGKLVARTAFGGGWGEVAGLYPLAKAKFDEKTPVRKVKAVLFTRFDVLQTSKEGAVLLRRSTLENSQITASLEALARFAAAAEAYGQGRYRISLDVSIENEPMRFGPLSGTYSFDQSFCSSYFGPRVNGGEYEAEDKVYRGPYDSVLFIHSGWKEDGEPNARVNGMPVSGIAFAPKEDMLQGQDLAIELLNRWCVQEASAFQRKGFSVAPFARFGLASNGSLVSAGTSILSSATFANASNRSRISTDEVLSRLAIQKSLDPKSWADVSADPLQALPAVDLPDLPARDLLQIVKTEGKRLLVASSDVADFVARNLKPNLEAKAIGYAQAKGSGGPIDIVFALGADPGEASNLDLLSLPGELAAAGDPSYKEMPVLGEFKDNQPEPYRYEFKPETDAKIAKAAALNDSSSQADRAEVVEMLSARDDAQKLNAALAYTRVKEPSAVKPLSDMLSGFNLRVVELAMKALAFQGGDLADQALHRALITARYGYVQAIAAQLTALKNDPKDAQYIAISLASDSWIAWLYGANAIAKYDDKNAQTFLMTYLWKTDPAVRLAATKGSNTKYDMPVKRLLWSAINDPSDMIRAEACIKLIESEAAANQDEGYKGVRDDSIWVRLQLLDYMQKNPNERFRKAIQIAIADSDAEVRAKALAALQALSGETKLEEIQNTLTDKDPRVQNALVELALAKKLKLPTDTIAALRSSLDTQVATRAKELAE